MSNQYRPETILRRKTLAVGSTLLASSIFTGPVAPVLALAGGACFVGVGLRHLLNKSARDDYYSEKEQKIVSKRRDLESSSRGSFYPESPETAIARKEPIKMNSLLKRESARKRYNEALAIGANLARNYLDNLSQEEYINISKIEIIPEHKNLFRRKSLEVRITK